MRLLTLLTYLALSATFYGPAYAAGPTFECDGTPYPTIGSNPTTIQQMDKQTLAVSTLATLTPSSTINATGFNILDNYIYGLNSRDFMQLASDGTYTMLGKPTGIGASAGVNWSIGVTYAGTMDSSGYWYGHDSNYVYRVYIGANPSAGSLTFERFARSGSYTGKLADLAFNPLDGSLYGMNSNALRRITIAGVGSTVATNGSLSGSAGGAWSTSSGTLYFYNNSGGQLYSVDMTASPPKADFVGSVTSNRSFDATACTPPVLLKSIDNAQVEPGDIVTFNFKISNPLSTPVTVEFTDLLEPGLSFVSGSLSPAAPGSGTVTNFSGDQLVISNLVVPSGLPPNNEVNFTAEVLIDPSISENTTITNQAEITYGVNTTLSDNPGGSIDDPTSVFVVMSDWGDAPSSYGDVKHLLPNADLFMGTPPDAEKQQQNTANGGTDGTGDDGNGTTDEDGVTAIEILSNANRNYSVDVTTTNNTELDATLMAWIDFDGNGTFDTDEVAIHKVPTGTNNSPVSLDWFNLPTDIKAGDSYLRLRLTTEPITSDDTGGVKWDGEVEDYPITIASSIDVSGQVYVDANSNATNDSGESGIANTTVVLRDFFSGICRSTKTNGNGEYHFYGILDGSYELYQAHGEIQPTPQHCNIAFANSPTGHVSTTPDVLNINVSGEDISKQDFGEVPTKGTTFEPNHQSEVLPGEVKLYPHAFSTKADGHVAFSSSTSGNVAPNWSSTLYHDSNCDGLLSASEASSMINGVSLSITTDNRRCIINKVTAPTNAPIQDSLVSRLTASFVYAGGNVPDLSLQVTDITIVGQSSISTGKSGLKLTKTVENLTQATGETDAINEAAAGDVIKYRIYYQNAGTETISDIHIKDTVPAFTSLVSASMLCDITPPALACSANINLDTLNWDLTGTLEANESGHVSYEVDIEN